MAKRKSLITTGTKDMKPLWPTVKESYAVAKLKAKFESDLSVAAIEDLEEYYEKKAEEAFGKEEEYYMTDHGPMPTSIPLGSGAVSELHGTNLSLRFYHEFKDAKEANNYMEAIHETIETLATQYVVYLRTAPYCEAICSFETTDTNYMVHARAAVDLDSKGKVGFAHSASIETMFPGVYR